MLLHSTVSPTDLNCQLSHFCPLSGAGSSYFYLLPLPVPSFLSLSIGNSTLVFVFHDFILLLSVSQASYLAGCPSTWIF